MPRLEPSVVCTHLEPAWLRAHGPARCELCGFVDHAGHRIDPISGRRLDGTVDCEMLYTIHEDETLLFVPKELARSMLAARRHLARCHTWGRARERLTEEWYQSLTENYAVGTPDDAEPLDGASIAAEWPRVGYATITEQLPRDVVEAFGESYSGLFDSGVTFPQERSAAMFRALARHSFRCRRDDRIAALFWEMS